MWHRYFPVFRFRFPWSDAKQEHPLHLWGNKLVVSPRVPLVLSSAVISICRISDNDDAGKFKRETGISNTLLTSLLLMFQRHGTIQSQSTSLAARRCVSLTRVARCLTRSSVRRKKDMHPSTLMMIRRFCHPSVPKLYVEGVHNPKSNHCDEVYMSCDDAQSAMKTKHGSQEQSQSAHPIIGKVCVSI